MCHRTTQNFGIIDKSWKSWIEITKYALLAIKIKNKVVPQEKITIFS